MAELSQPNQNLQVASNKYSVQVFAEDTMEIRPGQENQDFLVETMA
jgi:hypothetical protein